MMSSRLTVANVSSVMAESLLRNLLEAMADGVLLLTPQKEWIYGNYKAYQICQTLSLGQPIPATIPEQVWQVCQWFLDHANEFETEPTFEAEIQSESGRSYRVRVKWFHLEEARQPYLMVILEDCYQIARSRAIAEAKQYQLTERQAEVWLLHRTGSTYREIATDLFISLNTVKRHLKDIYVKQKSIASQGCDIAG